MTDNKVLICDDQHIIHETLGVYLRNEGFSTVSAMDGNQALDVFRRENPCMVILDLMMPRISGTEVCKQIKQLASVPIIMLTAKGEEIDRILGLELGADDYIVKPFSAREVVARVKAVLRRYTRKRSEAEQVLSIAGLEINLCRYEIKVNGTPIRFTPKEVEVLELLASEPGRVFGRNEILERVWGGDYAGDPRAVDTQIKRIRHKLPESGLLFSINSIYGIGYKFEF